MTVSFIYSIIPSISFRSLTRHELTERTLDSRAPHKKRGGLSDGQGDVLLIIVLLKEKKMKKVLKFVFVGAMIAWDITVIITVMGLFHVGILILHFTMEELVLFILAILAGIMALCIFIVK